MVATEYVTCETCLKEIPSSGAVMAEVKEYVAYFCGLECYEKWVEQRAAKPAPAAPAASR